MSFRTRLALFFVLIVVMPMVAAGVVVSRLVTDAAEGKADARSSAHATAAMSLYRRAAARGTRAAEVLGTDLVLGRAIQGDDRTRARERAIALARQLGLERVLIVRSAGGARDADDGERAFVDVGGRSAIAAGSARVRQRTSAAADGGATGGDPAPDADGAADPARDETIAAATTSSSALATIEASTITARQFVAAATSPGVKLAVRRDGTLLATNLADPSQADGLPFRGEAMRDGTDYVATSFRAADFSGATDTINVLADAGAGSAAAARDRRLAIGLLAGFLLLALLGALAVSRQLQAQIGRFLAAARRIGGGDFSTAVPTEGNDEFAALGREFNKMSHQLEQRIGDLARERERLRGSIQRVGDTFAANLDRSALLEIGTQTAVDAVEATCGRAQLVPRAGADAPTAAAGLARGPGPAAPLAEQARVGEPSDAELTALEQAEARAVATGVPASATAAGACALATPIPRAGKGAAQGTGHAAPAPPSTAAPHGLVSVARAADCPFSPEERTLLGSLAAQTGISLENVELHDKVTRQAVTDELTGLFNHRRFQEVIALELAAAQRYDRPLGLLMVDIDNFKRVNDTYGHQQGDLVLKEVARVLIESSREIDEPARYGGEEMAVALPETDLDGAYAIAERVRTAVEALRVPRLDGGDPLRVTLSAGVAATTGGTKDELIAAADAALYRAKHSGKNRTVRAAGEAVATA